MPFSSQQLSLSDQWPAAGAWPAWPVGSPVVRAEPDTAPGSATLNSCSYPALSRRPQFPELQVWPRWREAGQGQVPESTMLKPASMPALCPPTTSLHCSDPAQVWWRSPWWVTGSVACRVIVAASDQWQKELVVKPRGKLWKRGESSTPATAV